MTTLVIIAGILVICLGLMILLCNSLNVGEYMKKAPKRIMGKKLYFLSGFFIIIGIAISIVGIYFI